MKKVVFEMEAQVLEQDTKRSLQEAFESLPFLKPVVKDTLREFVRRLKEAEGENLLRVVLFGSMARGDFDEESDTDVFVLLHEGDDSKKTYDIAKIAAYEVCFTSSEMKPFVLLSPFVETKASIMRTIQGVTRWRLEPVFEAIREDGVLIYASE